LTNSQSALLQWCSCLLISPSLKGYLDFCLQIEGSHFCLCPFDHCSFDLWFCFLLHGLFNACVRGFQEEQSSLPEQYAFQGKSDDWNDPLVWWEPLFCCVPLSCFSNLFSSNLCTWSVVTSLCNNGYSLWLI
jgi:hypothetical protein